MKEVHPRMANQEMQIIGAGSHSRKSINIEESHKIDNIIGNKAEKGNELKSSKAASDHEGSMATLRVRDGLRGTLSISRQELRRRFGYQFDALEHPLAAAELPVHRYRCSACLAYPIVGARIQCLDCTHHAAGVHFCQKCFFSRRVSYRKPAESC